MHLYSKSFAGYAAKTEFNISAYGDLINGREEALVSLSSLRKMNDTYLYEESYGKYISQRIHLNLNDMKMRIYHFGNSFRDIRENG